MIYSVQIRIETHFKIFFEKNLYLDALEGEAKRNLAGGQNPRFAITQ